MAPARSIWPIVSAIGTLERIMAVDPLDASDLYAVLGVQSTADTDAIRHAYRTLARSLHPDVNPDADAARRFARVSHAHQVLSNPLSRKVYDQQRRDPSLGSGQHRDSPAARAVRGALRGNDVEVQLHMSLRASVSGVEGKVDVPRREVCAICIGSGATPGGSSVRCPRCLGTGGARRGDECARCQGAGLIGEPPCPNCLGSGRRQGQTQIIVAVPPGIEDGQRLVLKCDGDVGPRNGPRGDLILHVVVDPDPVLRRQGIDILMELQISAEQAREGTYAEVPTLKGTKWLRISPASRDRTLLRIGGAGLRLPGSWHKGDQFVTVRVLESGAPVAQLRSDPTDERDAAHG